MNSINRKKKILFIAYYFPPIKSGGTKRIVNFAKYLKKSGHEIIVLTAGYTFSTYKKNIIRILDISFNKKRFGFRYLIWAFFRTFVEIFRYAGFSSSIYKMWERNVLKNKRKIIEFSNPDIIVASYPPVETLKIGLNLSDSFNIPLIADFRDGLIFEPIEAKLLKKSVNIKRSYQKLEEEICRRSSFISTASDPISNYFKMKYKLRNVFTIYSGYDPDLHIIKNIEKSILNKKMFNIVFTGRLYLSDSSNSSKNFFLAVRELIEENPALSEKFKINLFGEFTKKELSGIDDLISKKIVINMGYLGRSQIVRIQKAADLLLIITSTERQSIVTTKIFEYLMAKKPILALTFNTELGNIVNETKTGWVVNPANLSEIKVILKRIFEKKDFFNSLIPDIDKIKYYSIAEQMKIFQTILYKIGAKDNFKY